MVLFFYCSPNLAISIINAIIVDGYLISTILGDEK